VIDELPNRESAQADFDRPGGPAVRADARKGGMQARQPA